VCHNTQFKIDTSSPSELKSAEGRFTGYKACFPLGLEPLMAVAVRPALDSHSSSLPAKQHLSFFSPVAAVLRGAPGSRYYFLL